MDKVKETGLNPIVTERGNILFEQDRLGLECRKLFITDMKEELFLDHSVYERWYGGDHGGLHRVYVAEIVDAWVKITPLPQFQVIFGFHLLFYFIRKGREKVYTCNSFHFVHCIDVAVQRMIARCILINEADGFGGLLSAHRTTLKNASGTVILCFLPIVR